MYEWSRTRLRRAVEQRHKRRGARRLGETLTAYVQKTILPRQQRTSGLGAAWAEVLPSELLEHTSLAGYRRGSLLVLVDSAAHLYELKLLLAEGLLEEVRGRCPHAGLREIKLKHGDWTRTEADRTPEKDDYE